MTEQQPPHVFESVLPSVVARLRADDFTTGGGSVAAIVVAMAAELVAMAARLSRSAWREAAGAVAQAEGLRARAEPLAQLDADAFRKALVTLRGETSVRPAARDFELATALTHAAEVPLQIAETALDVALLGAFVAEHANPDFRGDAVAATLLADGAARAAGNLVLTNLVTGSDKHLRVGVDGILRETAAASARATAVAAG